MNTKDTKLVEQLVGALELMIQSRDKHAFGMERYIESEYGTYWSPNTSMIGSEAVSIGRAALTAAKVALAAAPSTGEPSHD